MRTRALRTRPRQVFAGPHPTPHSLSQISRRATALPMLGQAELESMVMSAPSYLLSTPSAESTMDDIPAVRRRSVATLAAITAVTPE